MNGVEPLRAVRRTVEFAGVCFAAGLIAIASYPALAQVSFWIPRLGSAFPDKPQVWINVASAAASALMLLGMVEFARAQWNWASPSASFWSACRTFSLGLQIGGALYLASALATAMRGPQPGGTDWWIELGSMLGSGAAAVIAGQGLRHIAGRARP